MELFPGLRKRAIEKTKAALLAKGYASKEVDLAIKEAEGDHPFLELFMTYAFPLLLKLLENFILAHRATSG